MHTCTATVWLTQVRYNCRGRSEPPAPHLASLPQFCICILYTLSISCMHRVRQSTCIRVLAIVPIIIIADWQCRLPDCEKNRLKLEDGVYDFCSREHKIEFGKLCAGTHGPCVKIGTVTLCRVFTWNLLSCRWGLLFIWGLYQTGCVWRAFSRQHW
jgi:hypothetical protein